MPWARLQKRDGGKAPTGALRATITGRDAGRFGRPALQARGRRRQVLTRLQGEQPGAAGVSSELKELLSVMVNEWFSAAGRAVRFCQFSILAARDQPAMGGLPSPGVARIRLDLRAVSAFFDNRGGFLSVPACRGGAARGRVNG